VVRCRYCSGPDVMPEPPMLQRYRAVCLPFQCDPEQAGAFLPAVRRRSCAKVRSGSPVP